MNPVLEFCLLFLTKISFDNCLGIFLCLGIDTFRLDNRGSHFEVHHVAIESRLVIFEFCFESVGAFVNIKSATAFFATVFKTTFVTETI